MTDISVHSTAFQVEKRSWLRGPHGTGPGDNPSITLDVSTFTSGTHYPNGYFPSGLILSKLASGLYGPYKGSSVTGEVQTITINAAGGTFTITVEGEATAAIAWNATAAAVQAALELLAGIDPGDIVVTGGPGGTAAYTLTFGGKWKDLDAPAVTTGAGSLTGGAGTATVATSQAGGSITTGQERAAGLLLSSVKVPDTTDTTKDVGAALFVHGFVKLSKLPIALDADGQADLKLIHFVA